MYPCRPTCKNCRKGPGGSPICAESAVLILGRQITFTITNYYIVIVSFNSIMKDSHLVRIFHLRVKNFANWSLQTFLRFNFKDSPGKWSHTHKQTMCLCMLTHILNVFDGAKYFSKAISISISLPFQLSVKLLCGYAHTAIPEGHEG